MNTLRALFAHNDWARDRLMTCAAALDDARLDRAFDVGPGSLRKTLFHIWRAERIWLDRWLQRRVPAPLEPLTIAMDELWDDFRGTAREREAALAAAGPAGGARRIEYVDSAGETRTLPLGDTMLNVCNHGFHHRAQAANMLRRLGQTPPEIDYLHMVIDDQGAADASFDVDTLAEYFRYGDWASEQVFMLAAEHPDDDLDRSRDMGVGTLRKTVLHVHDTERWWLESWLGRPGDQFHAWPETTPIEELREAAQETARKRNEYLECLADDDLRRDAVARAGPDRAYTFRIGDAMVQLCGHGAHHRAQMINMLRQDGVTAPRLDYVLWLLEDAVG